jgi:hypothetical protein
MIWAARGETVVAVAGTSMHAQIELHRGESELVLQTARRICHGGRCSQTPEAWKHLESPDKHADRPCLPPASVPSKIKR